VHAHDHGVLGMFRMRRPQASRCCGDQADKQDRN
jgi:hypothetical protein